MDYTVMWSPDSQACLGMIFFVDFLLFLHDLVFVENVHLRIEKY